MLVKVKYIPDVQKSCVIHCSDTGKVRQNWNKYAQT